MRHEVPPAIAYIRALFAPESAATRAAREALEKQSPEFLGIAVGAEEGRLLQLLIRMNGIRRVVEIGSLAGYSGLWMAEALPDDGEIHLIEHNPAHAALIRATLSTFPSPLEGEGQGGGEECGWGKEDRQYAPQALTHAQILRQQPTDAEAKLWQGLNRKQAGVRFRRQHPIGNYIVDFVCLKQKLIVEVDGSHHADSVHDKKRDAYLTQQGFQIQRFWNNEVLQQTEGVLEKIHQALNSPPPTPSLKGRGGMPRIHLHQGAALDILPTLSGPFDMVFIDADKLNYAKYLDWAEANVRQCGLIVGDNTLLFGHVWSETPPTSNDAPSKTAWEAMREFNARLADPNKYHSVLIPTLEGMTIAVKLF